MKTLLTGASGFVGNHFQKIAASTPFDDALGEIDLRDPDRINAGLEQLRPDYVIHLAAQSFVPRSFENPKETFDINFVGTYNLLSGLKRTGFDGRFLFVGSGDMYGFVDESKMPIHEEQPLRPRNPYSVSKVAAESLCYQWSQSEDFDLMMTRSFNHVGPGQSDRFVISSFAKQIVEISLGKKAPLVEVGDIEPTRDFTDVRDVVKAYKLIIEKGITGEVYNVCSGREYSIRALLEQLINLAGLDVEITRDEKRYRKADQQRVCGDPQRLVSTTGWEPSITIDQTLSDVLNYWRKQLK